MQDIVKILKSKNTLYILSITIILTAVVLFALGFRFTMENGFGRTGKINIVTSEKNALIFVNQNLKQTTKEEFASTTIELSPKTHQIIISKSEFFPWVKNISIPKNGEVTIKPVLLPQNASGFIVGKNDSDYYRIMKSIDSNKAPTKIYPKISFDKKAFLFVENNEIIIEKDLVTYSVLKSVEAIKNVEFYQDRDDVVMFSAGDGVYLIEVSRTGGQNFMPIYKGKNPYFAHGESDFIFIRDESNLFQVMI